MIKLLCLFLSCICFLTNSLAGNTLFSRCSPLSNNTPHFSTSFSSDSGSDSDSSECTEAPSSLDNASTTISESTTFLTQENCPDILNNTNSAFAIIHGEGFYMTVNGKIMPYILADSALKQLDVLKKASTKMDIYFLGQNDSFTVTLIDPDIDNPVFCIHKKGTPPEQQESNPREDMYWLPLSAGIPWADAAESLGLS